MKLLYFSDIHLPLGPREPIRPELRRRVQWLNGPGHRALEKFENHLRLEAHLVRNSADRFLRAFSPAYDLLVNGGDNAMPLSGHEDRLAATEYLWKHHIEKFGADRVIELTGNHELGHGYSPEPENYPDFLALRKELFDREINRHGYGFERHNGGTLLAIDSELIKIARTNRPFPLVRSEYDRMKLVVDTAARESGPVLIITHNTSRVRKWLRNNGLLDKLKENCPHLVIVGGHFHIARTWRRDGMDIYWAGGASYPEPYLRCLVGMPIIGFRRTGPGAVALRIDPHRIAARHLGFGVKFKGLRIEEGLQLKALEKQLVSKPDLL